MKLKVVSFFFSISSLLLFSSCAQTHYAWNGYDQALYDHYKSPGEREQYIEKLKIIIQRAEESGKIPPGIYAEYGYTFYESGNHKQAIQYFQKESDLWPESRYFMAKMIRNAQLQGKQTNKNAPGSKQNTGEK